MTLERTSISIIIPTLNEADFIAGTLASIPEEPGLEVIVVDGGAGMIPRLSPGLSGHCSFFHPPGEPGK